MISRGGAGIVGHSESGARTAIYAPTIGVVTALFRDIGSYSAAAYVTGSIDPL
jgi:hypothetical protein